MRLGTFSGERMLDVGCGEGGFTMVLGRQFREVHGIDVQEAYLESFRAATAGDPRFTITNMSASAMTYPDAHFDTIVTIETLEHVPDLAGAAREMARVLRPGGEIVITVPNRWFPFENHGMRIGSWDRHGRIPLLTYLPWLHRRISIARVFKAGELDALFMPHGLRRAGLGYAWPTFEHPGKSPPAAAQAPLRRDARDGALAAADVRIICDRAVCEGVAAATRSRGAPAPSISTGRGRPGSLWRDSALYGLQDRPQCLPRRSPDS